MMHGVYGGIKIYRRALIRTFSLTELRKESRLLENEIDLKLVSFSKLGSNYSRDVRFV